MNQSELIAQLSETLNLQTHDVDWAVKVLLTAVSGALSQERRVEIRGFGRFCLKKHTPRLGRNPRTGQAIWVPGKHVLHFKPGKMLREQIDASAKHRV
jgi:integration host factor subunit beta